MSTTTKERIGTWRDASPVRKWRLKNGLSLSDAAVLLGVSLTAITKWESGVNMPAESRFEQLAATMKFGSASTLRNAWGRWIESHPTS